MSNIKKKIIIGIGIFTVLFGLVFGSRIIAKVESVVDRAKYETTMLTTKELETDWSGKKWNAVGDSITARDVYTKLVSKSFGLVVNNQGLSSSTVAVNDTYLKGESIYERTLKIEDADLWTVFGGTNDWLYKTPLGTIDSDDSSTFYGALNLTVENIINRPNEPKLILFTPLQSNRNGENEDGVTMEVYRQAIIDIGEKFNVPVLDLYEVGGINTDNLEKLTEDGIHPNIDGTKLFYPSIVSTIEKL